MVDILFFEFFDCFGIVLKVLVFQWYISISSNVLFETPDTLQINLNNRFCQENSWHKRRFYRLFRIGPLPHLRNSINPVPNDDLRFLEEIGILKASANYIIITVFCVHPRLNFLKSRQSQHRYFHV